MKNNIENILIEFSEISIRGRFAFAYDCIDKNIPIVGRDCIQFLKFWTAFKVFPTTSDIINWDLEIREFTPYSILSDFPEPYNDFQYATLEDYKALLGLYNLWPKFNNILIDRLYFIASDNLFVSSNGNSPITLKHLEVILQTSIEHDLLIQDIEKYRKYRITNGDVWGRNLIGI